tara:strand:+ start:90 stop:470 length:381 start_codon:yes stop_codon:yes gene_type:complete
MTKKKNNLTFEESHAKLYADMINYEEQENMGMMDEAIKETVQDKGFKKTDLQKEAMKATLKQVGGNHYKDCKVQPIEYIVGNDLTFCEGNAIKYITRHRRKGEGRRDIEKAIHYLEMILETEYNDK